MHTPPFNLGLDTFLDLVFPPRCLGCDAYLKRPFDAPTCPPCMEGIFVLDGPMCPSCGSMREGFVGTLPGGVDDLCGQCLAEPPAFGSACSHWEYDGIIAEALQRIKYGDDMGRLGRLTAMLRPWFMERVASLMVEHSDLIVIPLPMHRRDLRRRGFNMPALMVRRLLKKTGLTMDDTALIKSRQTPAQASLSKLERCTNLDGAFEAGPPKTAHAAAILFDDVMTTGATAREAAGTLKAAGWKEVHVLTAARAL
ncbi:MAG: double zinc ribbon domain-containing protein [Bradymonadaceae bacterium]